MLSLLILGQTADPWLRLAELGNDPKTGEIYGRLSAPQMPEGQRPPAMPIYREIASRQRELGDVFALCATAPIPSSPLPFTNDEAYPRFLGGVKSSYKWLIAVAAAEFYTGSAGKGAKLLGDGLKASYRLQSSSMLGGLVGIAAQSIVLSEIERRQGRFSVAELDAFAALTKGWLAGKPPYIGAIEAGEGTTMAEFDRWWSDPWPYLSQNAADLNSNARLKATWEALSPAARQAEGKELKLALKQGYRDALLRLNGPETGWTKSNPSPETKGETGLAESLAPSLGLLDGRDATAAVAKSWTQLRLLRLHMLVRAYRWRQDRWPATLAAAAGKEAQDPITNKPFTYRLEGGSYLLRSEGWPSVGPIELRYRREANPDRSEGGV